MPPRLTFSFYGDAQIDRSLARFADTVGDARPAWEAMAERFARTNRRQFATEGRHASGGWAPLSPRYAEWKAEHYPGKPILEREGNLVESLTRRPFGVEVIEPDRMVLGTDVRSPEGYPYAEAHQHGTGRMPQRRPVELREQERREWIKLLQRYIVTGKV